MCGQWMRKVYIGKRESGRDKRFDRSSSEYTIGFPEDNDRRFQKNSIHEVVLSTKLPQRGSGNHKKGILDEMNIKCGKNKRNFDHFL